MEEEASINDRNEAFGNGDILESVFSRLPLIHLLPASHVSRTWNRAVFFSLRRRTIKPWLFLYPHTTSTPYAAVAFAYDPHSRVWIHITIPAPPDLVSAVRSSHSTLLYALSPSRFSFSVDPLHLTWRHMAAPRLWRIDPIVAAVGRFVIIAGGVCYFEDDGLAVELLDTETGTWETCESMPHMLKHSAASTWLSVAVSADKMYLTEKSTGISYSFDPKTRSWTELFHLFPVREDGHCDVYSRVIGFAGDRLIMAGVTGEEEYPTGIELWEVTNESRGKLKSIGSMPDEFFDKLRGEDHSNSPLTSIALNAVGKMVFIQCTNQAVGAGEIVAAEMAEGKLCNWTSFRSANAATETAAPPIVAVSNVQFRDLSRALRDNCGFSIVP